MILILNGSPNKQGNTVSVLQDLLSHVKEPYVIINAYDEQIASCDDCKYCHYKTGCSKKDRMVELYEILPKVDTLIIASPLYFAALSSELLSLISRFQTYFSSKYVRKEMVPKINKGLLVVTAGGYWESMFVGVKETFKVLKMLFNIEHVSDLLIPHCDEISALESQIYKEKKQAIIEYLKSNDNIMGE